MNIRAAAWWFVVTHASSTNYCCFSGCLIKNIVHPTGLCIMQLLNEKIVTGQAAGKLRVVSGWLVWWCSAEQPLSEKLTSAVDNIAKSLPSQHQSKTRSDLLQKLLEHSHADSQRASSQSFTCVLECHLLEIVTEIVHYCMYTMCTNPCTVNVMHIFMCLQC